jgi:predicted amidohydrolase/GNAT superfamily N-acetyltransferase
MGNYNESALKLELRHLKLEDYEDLESAMMGAYQTSQLGVWDRKHIRKLLSIFPEGQLGVFANGKLVAAALSIIVDYQNLGHNHTYRQATGSYTFSTHDPQGDVLYGIEMFVHPDHRGLRLGRRLYDARKELCENLNLKSIIAGGRLPGYKDYASHITPKEYLERVAIKELFDPVLTFQLSNGFVVKRILKNYLEGDVESREFATLLEWNNIYYEENQRLINVPKQTVRLGLVQWQMRLFPSFDALVDQMEFFIDAISDYRSDFVLFPELFNAPLMADYNHLGEAEAIRKLAHYTEPLRNKFVEFALSYNINIVTGSMPYLDEQGKLTNIAYLCRRDGTWDSYSKIHITPSEREAWGMSGGNTLKVFDTDCGKVGIVICYDVEFPEVPRMLAEQGMQLLFVPFLTDTQNGYMRVRSCAKARAIENECYVAIAGSVGNLPRVNNMDIQYAQSAVFTPSDFPFPVNQVKAETTPNTEMTLIVDVDLNLLKELHTHGSVRTLKDRRKDLYEIVWKHQ